MSDNKIVPYKQWARMKDKEEYLQKQNVKFSIVADYIMELNNIALSADKNDIQTLYNCVEDYLALCRAAGRSITNSAICTACGVSQTEMTRWANGTLRKDQPEYREFALKVKMLCQTAREEGMADGTLNPVVGIFWQKAHDHMSDQPVKEIEYVPEETKDVNEIKKKYENLIED